MRKLASSFRDPNGFLFTRDGVLYRQINQEYKEHYKKLIESGLYERLIADHLLIPHNEVNVLAADPRTAYKVIQPEILDFISYPYEWCFSQLKDAALTTLAIQKLALEYGMWMKDASAYNIQFHAGRPVLIDTLSFEVYSEGHPWVAYRQFCQHFLAPLSLMAYRDVRLSHLLRIYIDGIPLDLASKLLPVRTRLSFPLLMHVHLHASAQRRYADKTIDKEQISRRVSRLSLLGLVDSLESCVRGLSWKPNQTDWANYYSMTNYSNSAVEEKERIIGQFLDQIQPESIWDLGANTGLYSRLASQRGVKTVAFDVDPGAVEQNYLASSTTKENCLLPLVMDLTNPSPALGWHHQERQSLLERGPVQVVMALALIHHLAISNNVPLDHLARFLSEACQWLIIEFVPKSDSQVIKLLATRKDIFPEYTVDGFEAAFGNFFTIITVQPISDSQRKIYLLKKIEQQQI